MRRHHESSADRLWKEKLDACVSSEEAIVVLFLVAVLVASMWVA
jgi:hypothetical protein